MKKFWLWLLVVWIGGIQLCVQAAPGVLVDANCKLYINGEMSREDAIALSQFPDHPMKLQSRELRLQSGKVQDLMELGGNFVLPEKNPAIISGRLLATEDGTCSLSIGADWWYEVYVNGKKVFETTSDGNIKYAGEDNYSFEVEVKEGVNYFSVYLLSGSAAWLLAGPVVAKDAEELDFRYIPYLTHADVGSVQVHFLATVPSAAYVDYREVGSEKWQRALELQGGLSRIDRANHRILLENLKEDTLYEYRAVLREHPEKSNEIYGPVRTFKTFTAEEKPFTLFFTSDTQMGMRNTRLQLQDYLTNCGGKNADFFVHGGDFDNAIQSSEGLFMECYPAIIGANTTQDMPLILLRGNHEYRGNRTGEFFEYFSTPDEKSYYGFRQGNTCFIVLDSGEDHPGGYDRGLMHEQRRWLEEFVKTDAFLTAKFHVIFCHTPGIGEKYMHDSMAIITDGIFTGENPAHKLHLWVAGHTHFYIRSMTPDSRSVRTGDAKEMYSEFKTDFAYVVNDGPGWGGLDSSGMEMKFDSEKIEIKSMGQDGKVFDHFSILPDGSVEEHFSSLEIVNF